MKPNANLEVRPMIDLGDVIRFEGILKRLKDARTCIRCEDAGKNEALWSCTPGSTCDNCKAGFIIDNIIKDLECLA
jgi:hypothetical protein